MYDTCFLFEMFRLLTVLTSTYGSYRTVSGHRYVIQVHASVYEYHLEYGHYYNNAYNNQSKDGLESLKHWRKETKSRDCDLSQFQRINVTCVSPYDLSAV